MENDIENSSCTHTSSYARPSKFTSRPLRHLRQNAYRRRGSCSSGSRNFFARRIPNNVERRTARITSRGPGISKTFKTKIGRGFQDQDRTSHRIICITVSYFTTQSENHTQIFVNFDKNQPPTNGMIASASIPSFNTHAIRMMMAGNPNKIRSSISNGSTRRPRPLPVAMPAGLREVLARTGIALLIGRFRLPLGSILQSLVPGVLRFVRTSLWFLRAGANSAYAIDHLTEYKRLLSEKGLFGELLQNEEHKPFTGYLISVVNICRQPKIHKWSLAEGKCDRSFSKVKGKPGSVKNSKRGHIIRYYTAGSI